MTTINWQPLEQEAQLEALMEKSAHTPQIIFKHSISCPVSAMAKSRLDRNVALDNAEYYLLDLWNFRQMSDLVAHKFGVVHQSPQLLVISNGKCVYHESHYGITKEAVEAQVAAI